MWPAYFQFRKCSLNAAVYFCWDWTGPLQKTELSVIEKLSIQFAVLYLGHFEKDLLYRGEVLQRKGFPAKVAA